MTIKIYWANIEKEWMRAKEPESVLKLFSEKHKNNNINFTLKCPSFKEHLKNVYALKSIYEYEFIKDNENLITKYYDKQFFDEHVLTRSFEDNFFSFTQKVVFFTEENSLEVDVGVYPFFEDNNITQRCVIIPGTLDIGKWYRPLDFAFYLKPNFNSFQIKEDEIYSYLKFNTKENIKFIQYKHTEKLDSYMKDIFECKMNTNKILNLVGYYNMMKTKKLIIDEIKKNLLSV
jgi:hypothetical protein